MSHPRKGKVRSLHPIGSVSMAKEGGEYVLGRFLMASSKLWTSCDDIQDLQLGLPHSRSRQRKLDQVALKLRAEVWTRQGSEFGRDTQKVGNRRINAWDRSIGIGQEYVDRNIQLFNKYGARHICSSFGHAAPGGRGTEVVLPLLRCGQAHARSRAR